ncbi:MAG: FAD-binding protein [Chloroflexales bacterium]|nr:FAD-binding protein [Chloroflexales bacterium]
MSTSLSNDTIVIGAGVAGLMAALGRIERGERVLVLAKGHGATHWSSGCIDLLGEAAEPLAALQGLAAERPEHPYALAGAAALERGLDRLRAACEAAGSPLVVNTVPPPTPR